MVHSFDVDIATRYGVNEAIIFNYIVFWVAKNEANNQNFFNGRYWTFNSTKALSKLFPYMSTRTIQRVIQHLIDENLILAGKFSNDPMKRINYYTLTDLAKSITSNCHNSLRQTVSDGNDNMTQSYISNTNIENTNTVIDNTVIYTSIKDSASPILSDDEKIDLMFEEFWKAYPNRRKYNKKGCKAKYKHIPDIEKIHSDIMFALEIHKRSKDWTKENGEFIPSPYVYLNQERWKNIDPRSEKQVIADEGTADFIDDMFGGND